MPPPDLKAAVPPPAPSGPRRTPTGPVSSTEAYSIAEFMARVGFSKGALATAKREGLKVRRAGGRSFVLGRDWLGFLEGR